MNIFQSFARQVGESLARQLDDALQEALEQRLGDPSGWTLQSLAGRLTLVEPPGRLFEYYCLDGKPILRVGKIQFGDNLGEVGASRTIEHIAPDELTDCPERALT